MTWPRCYRRDGTAYRDAMEWAGDFEDGNNVVEQTRLWNRLLVSTVWLGLDHNWGKGPPLIFETMVFPQRRSGEYCERYSTEEAAVAGHMAAVRYFRWWPLTFVARIVPRLLPRQGSSDSG